MGQWFFFLILNLGSAIVHDFGTSRNHIARKDADENQLGALIHCEEGGGIQACTQFWLSQGRQDDTKGYEQESIVDSW